MAELTGQVRQRTEDLQAFMRSVGSWQEEMEAKDNQLRRKAKGKKAAAAFSAAQEEQKSSAKRTSTEGGHGGTDRKVQTTKRPKEQRISSYDYDRWDKFDVDKALKSLEDDDASDLKDDSEDGSEDEEASLARLMQQAIVHKEKGNENFKAGEFGKAIECYTRGIQCDPTNVALPANRAMALLKMGQHAAAEADCTVAVDLDPTYLKAYQRRAMARARLGKLEEALSDFRKVLELEPEDRMAKKEVGRLRDLIATKKSEAKVREEKKASGSDGKTFSDNIKGAFSKPRAPPPPSAVTEKKVEKGLEPGEVHSISKLPSERSRKPLKRILITEIGDVEETQSSSGLQEEVPGASLSGAPPLPRVSKGSGLQPSTEKEIIGKMEKAKIVDKDAAKRTPPRPRNAVQFLSTWKTLPDSAARLRYLRGLSGRDYPALFKHSLEPAVFSEILDCLCQMEEDASSEGLDHLVGLANVPRISAIAMLMGEKDVGKVRTVLERASSSDSERVKKIMRVFSLG